MAFANPITVLVDILVDMGHFKASRRKSDTPCGLWKLDTSLGPYGWKESMSKTFLRFFYCSTLAVIAATAYGAFRQENYTIGFLNLVGFALFLSGAAGGKNKYCTAPHICKGDMLRVPNLRPITKEVFTSCQVEATVSIVSGLQKSNLNIYNWTYIEGKWMIMGPDGRSNRAQNHPYGILLTPFVERVSLTNEQLSDLAEWISLRTPITSRMRKFDCMRSKGTHLIGANLAFALCHAEHLVFVGRLRLPTWLQKKVRTLRNMKFSGAHVDEEDTAIGFSPVSRVTKK